PRHAGSLEACMRAAHSLKGAARIVGLDAGVKVAHVMEDCLVEAQEGRLLLSPEHIDALLQGADILLGLGTPAQPGAADPGIDALVARLGALARGLPVPPSAPAPAQPAVTVTQAVAPPEQPVIPPAVEPPVVAPPARAEASEPASEGRARILRVSAERLDHLLDISSKSLVEFQRIKPLGDSLQRLKRLQATARRALDVAREALPKGAVDAQAEAMLLETRQALGECQQLLAQHMTDLDDFGWQGGQRAQSLYDAALASRMRPFADVLAGQERMLRDLSRSLGKQVRFVVEGEGTQVDRDVLERLEAPLTHLLRNALDHGIETPERRVAQGKPAEGQILIRARHHAGMLLLELRDDGGGVDLEKLRRAVIERGFATEQTGEQLTEEELLAFLFLPGFSMRDQVTEVSGRGVGLDAVQ
ncbi:MAG: hybrid sensor histidine kinase/response regulator, partial [Xanthomonas perforans]|nr:hybrid sensor histidine kinase/response regulator [Xanthomonas perforans]